MKKDIHTAHCKKLYKKDLGKYTFNNKSVCINRIYVWAKQVEFNHSEYGIKRNFREYKFKKSVKPFFDFYCFFTWL